MTDAPAIAVTVTTPGNLAALPSAPVLGEALAALGWRRLETFGCEGRRVERLHIGSEYCERLIPAPAELETAVTEAGRLGAALTLTTPMAGDAALARLRRLLPLLPEGSEVVANDWGVLRLLARDFPALVARAGRMLCRMVKDPRLPSETWGRLYPHGLGASPFVTLLGRFGVRGVEMDVAPFARAEDFAHTGLPVALHVPYGSSVKGRICRPGSLHQEGARKFAPGHGCRLECLDYVGEMRRHGAAGLHTFQRGNTIFYRHSKAMEETAAAAVAAGSIDRLVFSGDWNENHRADQPG